MRADQEARKLTTEEPNGARRSSPGAGNERQRAGGRHRSAGDWWRHAGNWRGAGGWRRASLVACLVAFAVLWVGGVATHWLGGAEARGDQGGIASLFLFLAGLIVLLGARTRASAVALGAVAVVGFTVEAAGVYSGVPFGDYSYTAELRPQLFGVPLVMGLAWMSLVAQAREVCAPLRLPFPVEAAAAALWLTAIDLVIDPLAANVLGYWRWSNAGNYYGIPATNFAGWFLTGLLAYGLFGRQLGPNLWARVVGFAIVLFFALLALAHSLVPAALVGFALCAAQLFLRRAGRQQQ